MSAYIPYPVPARKSVFESALDFFSSKGALSPETAVELTKVEWIQVFGAQNASNQPRMLKILTFIKSADGNKLWLDIDEYQEFMLNMKKKGDTIGFALIGFLFVGVMLFLLFGL